MKEPTGELEAEIESYKKQIEHLTNDIEEHRRDLEIANRTITHLEGLIEQFKYQAFLNQKYSDDYR